MEFIHLPLCYCCGFPLPYTIPEEGQLLCGNCIKEKPPYTHARALFRYTSFSKPLILHFKYYDHTHLEKTFVAWWLKRYHSYIMAANLIVPVPLHRWRLLSRQYNQAALLALTLSKKCQIPTLPNMLIRHKATPPQTHLPFSKRKKNVNGAFSLRPQHTQLLKDAIVLLVDDVMTTGATVHACTRVLLKAGAKEVRILTVARTLQTGISVQPENLDPLRQG